MKRKQKLEMVDEKTITLGTRLKDLVTGFEGIAIAKVIYFNGCIQYMLKPTKLDKDGKTMEAIAVDAQQLAIVDNGIIPKEKKPKKSTGGIMSDTPKGI